jgi:putative membrane protein
MNSLAEIAHGRLAVANASRDEVKRFGQRMIDDHTRSNAGLQPPRPQDRSIVPTELDEKHRAMQRSLEKVKGEQFDRLYLQHVMQMHAQAIERLQHEARTAKSAQARDWAKMTLPMLQEHLKMATAINAGLATSAAK